MPSIGGNFLEVRDCVFIKGFPSDSGIDVSDVREYFENKVGKCCVQMTALSKDKRWSFITLKFDSNALAEDAIDRFNGNYIWGHKVRISFWRVPKSLAESGRFQRNNHNLNSRRWDNNKSFEEDLEKSIRHSNDFSRETNTKPTVPRESVGYDGKEGFRVDQDNRRFQRNNHNLNSRRWDDKRSFEEDLEKSIRHSNDFSRETNTKPTVPRESVGYDGKEEFRVDQDNRRYHEGTFAERRKNFNYKEHCDEYSQQYWNSDEVEEEAHPIFDEKWPEWDSDFSGRNENLFEREYYDREEELSQAHEEDIWPEMEVDHERDQDFGQYDCYPEIYQDDPREECEDSHYAYSERPFEDVQEEPPFGGEDVMPRNQQWYDDRECTDTQDCRSQEGNNSFPSLDKERQWPRWEAAAPSSPIRRKPSDSDLSTDTPEDSPWVQNPRSCNKLSEFTGRRAAALSEERPRSDEWVRNNYRHFRDRGGHSTSPVNVRPKADGQRGTPLLDKTFRASPEISSNSAHSRRGRSRISPARNRHSSANRESSRSLSAERSSDFRHQGSSPDSKRSSQAFNEQRLEQNKRESRSYSPNPNTKVPLSRGRNIEDGNGNGGRRGTDLRRSLMLHQQRKHSSLRERSREKSMKHSERTTKTFPDKRDKSPDSYSSAESSCSTQGTNRKRNKYDDEKRRYDVGTTKRKRTTSLNKSDNASTYSDPENGNKDPTRRKILKTTSESRNQPSLDKKRKTAQQREHVTDHSIKTRADRLLNDVAVTLTKCKIPLRRPGSKEDSSKERKYKSSRVASVAFKGDTGQSEGSHPGENSRLEHATSVATENPQSLDAFQVDQCTNETPVEDWTVGGTPEGNINTPDNNSSHLAVSLCEGSSDQDTSEVEDYSSIDLSNESLGFAEKSAWTEETSTENHDFVDVKKNWTCIADGSGRTDRVEVHESHFQRTTEEDFTTNVEDERNSMQENCTNDEPKTKDEPAEKPVHNFYDFALYQSPIKEKKIATENDTSSEVMPSNLQPVHMAISSAEETTPKLDLAHETWLPGVNEEGKNQLGTSSSSTVEVGSESDCIVCQRDVQTSVQQTSYLRQELGDTFSSEETSPGVLLSNKVFCDPVELNNAENAMVEREEEDHIMEKVSPDVAELEHRIPELGNDSHSVNPTRPEGLLPEVDVFSVVLNAEALKQEGYNTEDNCNNSGILAACTQGKVKIDAIYTEQEKCVSENEYRTHSHDDNNFEKEVCKVGCCEVNPQYIDDDNEDMTDVISAVLEVHELEDNVNYLECQEATCTHEEVYILEDANVTQREVYDIRDIDHVYYSRSEECQGNGADFDVTNKEQVCLDGVNDHGTEQNVSNKVGAGEDISNREDTNIEDVVVDTNHLEQEQGVVESIDVTCREENSNNVWNMKDMKNNSENATFINAFNTEKVCDMESNDVTSGVNNAKEEKHSSSNVDFINEEQKYDDTEQEVYNMVDGCVTQQEVYCSKDENRSNNTGTGNHTKVSGVVKETDTDQGSYQLDTNSYNMADAQVTQETLTIINNTTEDPRLKFSCQEVQLSEEASKGKPADIGTHHTCWTGLEPCDLSAAQAHYSTTTNIDAIKSSAFPCGNSNSDLQVKESLHLVTEDFEHVDMEISSDEEHRDHFIGSSIHVNTSTSTIEKDGCKLYSPSSPTWRSDRSPLPKDDTSPYSPSHPTNVSDGDVEVSTTTDDLSCQTDAPVCNAIEPVYPEVCKNKSGRRGADEEEEVFHFNQIIKDNSMSDTTPRSSRYSRSTKSGAVLFQSISLATDFIGRSLPTKDLIKNRNITSDENGMSPAKDSEVCLDNSTTDEGNKDNVKPLLRSEKRTKSLPATVSMDAKPKVVYVTAAKTYDFFTNSDTGHKPRILYATNDTSAGRARSVSLDTALGKGWSMGKSSHNRPGDCDQQPTFVETISTVEVERRKDGKDTRGHVEPLFPGSFISDVPVKRMKFVAEDDDQAAVKINTIPKSARSEEGADNCTVCDGAFIVGKESLPPSCKANQDTFLSGSLPESDGLLVIQPPLESRQNRLPNEHCVSSDQAPSKIIERESNWERYNVNNMSGLSGETPGTSDVPDKRPLVSTGENRDFGFSDQGTSKSKSSVQPESAVLEVEGENEEDVHIECLREIQHQRLPLGNVQTLSNSTSCSANKRTHPDSTIEAPRRCKVPRKPLKLIIPTTPLVNHDIKRTSQPAHRGRYFKKASTSTVTHASVNVVPESNSLKVLQGDVLAVSEFPGDQDTVMTEKDSNSENVELACSLSPKVSSTPAITDCPAPTCKTGNTSPFTAHRPPCKTSNENNNIMEKEADSCSGKESEWISLRMERLRKKKEEIEQVYKRECHTVVNVVKMLVSNDPRLEGLLQNAVRRSLQDMGRRCVQELEKQVRPGS